MTRNSSRQAVRRAALFGGLGLVTLQAAFAQATADGTPPVQPKATAAASLESVTVIGKRAKQARDIAGAVSAVSGEQLENIGAQDLADYIQREPGVVFNSYQPGVSHVVLRGIATSSGNVQGQATTGYFLNEIPLTEPGWTIVVPDIDTFDLARVEVLRGPQGTLFGSGAMGGAIQYVANVADSHGFDAAAETTLSSTHNAKLAYTAKAMINVPIKANVLAVRAVAEYRKDPGYLDNIGTGVNGSNTTTLSGGRFSAVLTPSHDTTVTWLSLLQKTDADDNGYRIQGLGGDDGLERDTAIAEPTNTKVTVHSLRLDQELGWAKLTALAAYQTKEQFWQWDYTPVRGAYNSDLQLNLTNPLYINDGGKSHSKSLEVRLASPNGGNVEWLIGAMVFDTDKDLFEQLGSKGAAAAFDASPLYGAGTGAVISPDGEIFNAFYTKIKGKESAIFGEATFALNDQWKLTAGGRYFRTSQDVIATTVGFSTYPGAPAVSPSSASEQHFNPKLSLAYTASPDMMVYALASEGFRFGTPNTQGISKYPVPAGSNSDSLRNYELGMRSRWADGKVLFDATLFYIDWSDIQLRLQTPDFIAYATNGGKAYSRGLEMSFQWHPTNSFDWSTTLTFQHARLDEDLVILYAGTAPKGSRLPGTADWSINNSVGYHFGGAYAPVLSLSHQFLSSGVSDLNSDVTGAVPSRQGNYNLFDLRYRMNLNEHTTLSAFVSNLTDKRGITRSVPETNGIGQGLVRPRTVGVTAHWQY